ncbi:MAG TPA: START domain-containing protein [Spirochaetota bacterium]|nr:START domain-containing protein [Spirochaetota bacterium]HPC39635.1 START domain-containing protein [Spirochaetota bacterium]HPL16002.1 START domain-containing protein [Spirochaetota bacterium]HQF07361.1 START domain-containing protein [Spirochaetota bacterium]HQH99219.1 START domain-containing protein [Spirochaetota bacterium]
MKYQHKLMAFITACALVAVIPFYAAAKEEKAKDAQKTEVKKDHPWVLKKNKDGIQVFVRDVDGIDFKEFLGVTVMDAPMAVIDKIISDVPNQVNWMCDTIESKVVKNDPVNPIQYNVVTAPLVSNRDVVIQTHIVRTPTKIVRTFQGINLDSVPPRKGIVRMPKMVGVWMFEAVGKNQTKVTYQNLADPGGSLPSGLVNMTVVKMPFVTLQNMKLQIPKFSK